jgi:hypothetical protein
MSLVDAEPHDHPGLDLAAVFPRVLLDDRIAEPVVTEAPMLEVVDHLHREVHPDDLGEIGEEAGRIGDGGEHCPHGHGDRDARRQAIRPPCPAAAGALAAVPFGRVTPRGPRATQRERPRGLVPARVLGTRRVAGMRMVRQMLLSEDGIARERRDPATERPVDTARPMQHLVRDARREAVDQPPAEAEEDQVETRGPRRPTQRPSDPDGDRREVERIRPRQPVQEAGPCLGPDRRRIRDIADRSAKQWQDDEECGDDHPVGAEFAAGDEQHAGQEHHQVSERQIGLPPCAAGPIHQMIP